MAANTKPRRNPLEVALAERDKLTALLYRVRGCKRRHEVMQRMDDCKARIQQLQQKEAKA